MPRFVEGRNQWPTQPADFKRPSAASVLRALHPCELKYQVFHNPLIKEYTLLYAKGPYYELRYTP